jgi:hypothetical protein
MEKYMADFGSMTNEQREEHYQKVCKSLGIDPTLRLLDYIWMNNDHGPRSMVLYARRGAAEVFRQTRGISVTKTLKEDGDGYVSFTVEGVDKSGRTEIAVGVSSTKGLTGERLAYSLMTAHTRATRRLTLQFVGQGLLDESEVNAPTTDIGHAPASLASLAGSPVVMPPPQVPVASAPGKDITEKPVSAVVETPLPSENVASITMDVKPDNVQDNVPKKRTRKPRGQKDISSPGQQTEMPVANIDAKGNRTPVEQVSAPLVATATSPVTPTAAESVPSVAETKPPVAPSLSISPEKLKEYRERLSKYSQDILPGAKMMPSDGIGGVTMKLKKFAEIHTGAAVPKLTEEQFEDVLGFLDSYAQKNGAPALVEYINKSLGVA